LMLGLAVMPFFSLVAVVGLTYYRYDSLVYIVSKNQGLAVLPAVLLGSLLLLRAIITLTDYERLQSESRLSALREMYYQGLQREQNQVRTLRHDMRNHMAVLQGLLDNGDTGKAEEYLRELLGSAALSGGRRICAHETANAVLSVKLGEMERLGIPADFQVNLPEKLDISDTDLCALLGNALDNAMEACTKVKTPDIRLRCRMDKGMLMLMVSNPLPGDEKPGLGTTKADGKTMDSACLV
ncbi:MAG: GHKL domain-containing protein, partial [Oscillospiraceae bacterium]